MSTTHPGAVRKAWADRNTAVEELRALANAAQGREFYADERRREERLNEEIARIDEVIGTSLDEAARSDLSGASNVGALLAATATNPPARPSSYEGRAFSDLPDGQRAATADEAGNYLSAITTGNWSNVTEELRAQSEGTSGKGGYAVPTPVAATILDLARNAMRVREAGATVFPMTSSTQKLAKVTADATPAWRSEAGSIAESDMTLGVVTLTAQSLGLLVKFSLELMEDAPNVGAALSNSMAQAMALELDRASLFGSGSTPEPLGVVNTSGVTVTPLATNGAQLSSYAPVVTAKSLVQAANFVPTAAIMAPRTEAGFANLADTTGQPLRAPAYLDDLPFLATSQVPITQTVGSSGAVTSSVIVGDFSELIIGMRTELTLIPVREAYLGTGQQAFVAWLRADIQVARSAAFQVVSGIKP
jgi:HK97 family phage major capsid protein